MIDDQTKQIVDKFKNYNDVKFKRRVKYVEKKSYPISTLYYIVIIYGKDRFSTILFKIISDYRHLLKHEEEILSENKKRNAKYSMVNGSFQIKDENNLSNINESEDELKIDLNNVPVKKKYLSF